MVWYSMVWFGVVWYGMAWYGMVRYGMVWCGMVWYTMVHYGMVWYGMVWCGVVRCITNQAFNSYLHEEKGFQREWYVLLCLDLSRRCLFRRLPCQWILGQYDLHINSIGHTTQVKV